MIFEFIIKFIRQMKMTFTYSKELVSSSFTDVENAFITEYLPVSSGTAVKVYLYGLFLCKNPSIDQSIDDMGKILKLEKSEIIDCFKYWEEFGICSILSNEPFSVSYLPIRTGFGTKPRKYNAEKYTEFSGGVQALLPGRMISTHEYQEYYSIMETYSIKPEAMLMIVKYCVDKKGTDIGYKYISTVAKDFGARGITTVEKVEKELESYVLRTSEIEKILKALKLKRTPEIEDLKLLRTWTKDLEFDIDNIVFAASKIKKGSMAKLDEFLKELYSKRCLSKEEIQNYVSKKQSVFELTIKINKALSVFIEVLDAEIDNYVMPWISLGFSEETLLFIASHSFRIGKNTLQDMNDLVLSLQERGIIELSSVGDYFESIKNVDKFISKMLLTAGVNRRPTEWDRNNLNVWKSWNFSEDMILEAAKLSAGKTSPVAYMNSILSQWKNNSVYTINGITSKAEENKLGSQEAYNLEYERRRELAIRRANNNYDKAMNLDGFSEIYSRLNAIEKDLAFAEINGNALALEKFENEKKDLIEQATSILSSINLDLTDLSPKYACSKCNDTGYVGTHRCDCFNKKVD